MNHSELPQALDGAKRRIKQAFIAGRKLTTYTGNKIGHTVDFRKIVSTLRGEGMNIVDRWERNETDNRRFKVYRLERNTNKQPSVGKA